MTKARLRAGLIAAGDGSRLKASHASSVKPLVPVAGAPLCHWVVSGLAQAGVSDITALFNSRGRAAAESLAGAFPALRWTFLQEDTASSWESFRLVSLALAREGSSFLISTVDALIAPAEVARFARAMSAPGPEAGLALTDFIDDEKPLWADLDDRSRVCALGAAALERRYATAGLYHLSPETARRMPAARDFGSLREYLGHLVEGGGVAGLVVKKAVDVDRPQDIRQAEEFIASW